MKSATENGNLPRLLWIVGAVTWVCLSASGLFAAPQSKAKATPAASAPAVPAHGIKTFGTPQ